MRKTQQRNFLVQILKHKCSNTYITDPITYITTLPVFNSQSTCVLLGRYTCHTLRYDLIQQHSGILPCFLSNPPLSLPLPLLQSPPPSSLHSSCTQYLHTSRWGAVSLVAVVVALEYSCLASLHKWEIREPSTVPLNGKISPHRLLYCMHSLLLSFNPLSSPALLIFPSSFRFPLLQSSFSLFLSISLNPLLTFIPPPLFPALFLSCACFEHTRTRTWVSGGAGASYITL